MLYEALWVIVGPFFNFAAVKLKGPNKHLKHKHKKIVAL